MAENYQIEPVTRRCVVTGNELQEGEEFFAVLFEEGEGFRREDISLDSWKGKPEGAYCFFRSRVPVRQKKKKVFVDDDMMISFFLRLADATEEARLHFRFVLALILMRKRLLRYDDTIHEESQEYWKMRLMREPQNIAEDVPLDHKVLNPQLDESQIEAVSAELGAILHGDTFQEETQEATDTTAVITTETTITTKTTMTTKTSMEYGDTQQEETKEAGGSNEENTADDSTDQQES